MPPFKPDKHRLCACGCGEETPLVYDRTGRFKGYLRGIAGHRRKQWSERTRPARMEFLERAREVSRQPLGTKRLHATRSTTYYVVKVAEFGKWPYEHRVVMEQFIGRKLTNREHIHHRNGDTLDNRIENLQIVTPEEHRSIHAGKA